MSRKSIGAACLALAYIVLTNVVARAEVPSVDKVRAAIASLQKDPLAATSNGDVALIEKFAEESEDVLVNLNPQVVPYARQTPDAKHAKTLFGAFLAGNVLSQLDSKKNADDSYAGAKTMLATYAQLTAKDPTFTDEHMEKLAAMEKEGKLKAFIEETTNRRGGGMAPSTQPGN